MKPIKILFLVTGLFVLNIASQAQHLKLTSHEKALIISLRMQKTLNLTDEQQGKVLTATENSIEKRMTAHQKFAKDTAMLKKSFKEIRVSYEAELKQIFSSEQYELYLQKKKELREEHQKNRKEHDKNKPLPKDGK